MGFKELCVRETPWALEVTEKLKSKMAYGLEKAQGLDFIPYTVQEGQWAPGPFDGVCWWTNGFWAASMWQMYLMTNDERYKTEAERCEEMLDDAFRDYDHLHHDVGFMWHISAGVNYRLTGSGQSRKRNMLAASLLAGRYNPLGFIRAWNGDCIGWAIIDCMMNIPLLFWAHEHTNDPRFLKIAMNHADMAMAHFVREDGSCNHIVQFDPDTMAVLEVPGGQGYGPGSSWSRGQGWALYGFVLAYIHTGKEAYLNTAKKIAHYFMACVGEDGIPDCDFRAPKEPVIKDNIAGSLAACALLELAKLSSEYEQELYFTHAMKYLKAMESTDGDWSKESPAIFRRCTGAYHNKDRHIYTTYGDYYFIEAVNKLRGETLLVW